MRGQSDPVDAITGEEFVAELGELLGDLALGQPSYVHSSEDIQLDAGQRGQAIEQVVLVHVISLRPRVPGRSQVGTPPATRIASP